MKRSFSLPLAILFSMLVVCTLFMSDFARASSIKAAPSGHLDLQAASPQGAHFAGTRQATRAARSALASVTPLTYHGGPIMQNSTTYAIFWEPSALQDGTPAYVSPTYNSLIQQYFTDVGGSGLFNNNTQYYDSVSGHIVNTSTLGGMWVDTSPFPPSGCADTYTPGDCLSDAQVRSEILNAMSVNGWSGGPNRLFFVFTPMGEGTCQGGLCSFANFCAYHRSFTSNSTTILYANIPYQTTDSQGCGVPTSPNSDIDADSSISMTSHEHMESVTDPLFTAWKDSAGNEIGDKCGFQFGSIALDNGLANVQWNGHYYVVQEEFSNALSRCVITRAVSGTVFTGCDDAYFYALDASSGSSLWRSQQTGNSIVSTPAIANGVIYVGSNDGSVYAFSASDGSTLWSYATGGAIASSPAVVNGVVYIGSNDGYVYALQAATGTLVWRFLTGGPVSSSPTVSNGIVYVGSNDGNLYAIFGSKGKQKWLYATGGSIDARPMASAGVVYVGSHDSYLYAVNATYGTLLWRSQTGSGIVHSSAAVANKTVYVGSTDGNVYAFTVSSGSLAWSYHTGAAIVSSALVTNNVLYIGSQDSYVYALNAKVGTLIWRYQTGGQVSSSPKAIDGLLFFGSSDTFLYSLWADDGSFLWRYQTGGAVESSPVVMLTSY